MIQLTTLKVDTRYVPGTNVYFIEAEGGRPTLRYGEIAHVEVLFFDDGGSPEVFTVAIRERSLARTYFGEISVSDVYLDAGSAARALAGLMSEK